MELFYSTSIEGGVCYLDKDESAHCTRVLRHHAGDEITVIDGSGTLYRCRLTDDNPKGAQALVLESEEGWGAHPYRLTMAVCPTKNIDRYEWFAEKACEIGFDVLVPVTGDHSERKVIKPARLEKILVSAAKQSLKAAVPSVLTGDYDDKDCRPMSVKDFILSSAASCKGDIAGRTQERSLKMIAYCFEDESIPRRSIVEVLNEYIRVSANDKAAEDVSPEIPEISVLIGPEGDFSKEEAQLALQNGFIPVHLGPSRLRTETAALTAVQAVYLHFLSR